MDELRQRQRIVSQLVEARMERGISQAELARRVGTQRSNICRLESGMQNLTLDMILKIASALGKDISFSLKDKEEPMGNVYSLRLYDTELMRFSMEKQGLSGLVAEIIDTNEEQGHLLPLDLERTGEGVIRWLERRVIPKNRAFVEEILKTLGLSHNDTKGIIDVCRGLSLNDSFWVVPEGFDGKFSQYNLYENRFSEMLSLVAYTGAGGSRQRFTTSPELTTGGMLPKAWRYEEGAGIYLYKGGTSGAIQAGSHTVNITLPRLPRQWGFMPYIMIWKTGKASPRPNASCLRILTLPIFPSAALSELAGLRHASLFMKSWARSLPRSFAACWCSMR